MPNFSQIGVPVGKLERFLSSVRKDEEEKEEKKRRKKCKSLLARISGVAGAIYFKFGMWPPLIGRRLHNKFGFDRIKDHGVMNA